MHFLSILELLKEWDTRLFLLINGGHFSFLDGCMHEASSKFFWIPLYLIFLLLLIKKYKIKTLLILVFVALTITLSDQISLHLFKNIFLRYRPCHNLMLASQIHLVDDCGGLYGFVSSHAANTFALAFFLFRIKMIESSNYIWLFVWAALVSYSRIYLGQHYPADVLVGALVGICSAFLVSKLYFYTQSKINHV